MNGAVWVVGTCGHKVTSTRRVNGGNSTLALRVLGRRLEVLRDFVGEVAAADEPQQGGLVRPHHVSEHLPRLLRWSATGFHPANS